MHVDRCVCHNRSFKDLLALARDRGLDAEALREVTGCGTSCGLCWPYVRLTIATGEFRHALSSPDAIEARLVRIAQSREAPPSDRRPTSSE